MVSENGSKRVDYPAAAMDAGRVAFSIRELGDFTSDKLAAHLEAKGVTVPSAVLEDRLGHLVAAGWLTYQDGRYHT
ncbi:MAG: hypothetical protein ACMXYM_00050 [Candidatus Woesearchaeota archaeon]